MPKPSKTTDQRELRRAKISLEQAEAQIKRNMDAKLVSQRFDGGLTVHPEHLYVDRETGQRALRDLERLVEQRPQARRPR